MEDNVQVPVEPATAPAPAVAAAPASSAVQTFANSVNLPTVLVSAGVSLAISLLVIAFGHVGSQRSDVFAGREGGHRMGVPASALAGMPMRVQMLDGATAQQNSIPGYRGGTLLFTDGDGQYVISGTDGSLTAGDGRTVSTGPAEGRVVVLSQPGAEVSN